MIRFKYTPAFEDWRALNVSVLTRQFRVLLIIAAVLTAGVLVLPLLQRFVGQEIGLWESYRQNAGALILPGILGCIYLATLYAVRRRWKTASELREEREFVFDDSGISVEAATFSGRMEWRNVVEADVVRGIVMLKTTQSAFYYFPRRLVPDWAAFHARVAAHVKVTKRFRAN